MLCVAATFALIAGLMHKERTAVTGGLPKERPGEVELVFLNSWGGLDGRADALQKLLDDFMEKNPGIKVKNESVYGDDFLPSIKTRFALGEEPDVFGLWPGSDIRSLIAAGKVADLTGLLEEDPTYKASFDPKMWHHVTAEGRIYGLPVEIIFEALFINSPMFDLYDIPPPETYDQLVTAVKVFRANNIIPIAYNSEPEGSYLYQNLVMMLGGKDGVEQPFSNRRVKDCYIEAMYRMRELYELGAFPKDYFTLTSEERDRLFLNKKAAMIVQGSWFISNFPKDKAVDLVAFPKAEPAEGTGNIVYGMGCGIFYASKTAMENPEKTEAVIKLLKFLASKPSAAYLADTTGMISNIDITAYRVGYSEDRVTYNPLTQKGLALVFYSKGLVGPPDSFIERSVWESVIIKRFPYMLERKISPEELWQLTGLTG